MSKPKIILFDIETGNLKADLSPILCVGYKELGAKKVDCISIWDTDYYKKVPHSKADREVCESMVELFESADLLVGHYAQRFDRKFVNSRLLMHRLPPIPRHLPLVDTWRIAKDNILITSNRLGNIGKAFELAEKKADSGGWNTWIDAIRDDKKAQRKLIEYCKQDVIALEKIYELFLPLVNKVPNYNLFGNKEVTVCPNCGSKRALQSKGWRHTSTTSYRRFKCRQCLSMVSTNAKGLNPRTI